ncbi:MAG: hypothetical protein ACWGOX_15160 [Desulforhopalus sp.]
MPAPTTDHQNGAAEIVGDLKVEIDFRRSRITLEIMAVFQFLIAIKDFVDKCIVFFSATRVLAPARVNAYISV